MFKKLRPEPKSSLGRIEHAAAQAEEAAAAGDADRRLDGLEARIASIEPLLEQLQANAELSVKIQDHIGDLRSEQRFFNVARWVLGVACITILVGLITILGLAIFHSDSPLLTAPP